MSKATIKRTLSREMPNGDYVEAHIERRGDEGTLSPGYAITGSAWEARSNAKGLTRKKQDRDIDSGGMIHDRIRHVHPTVAKLIPLHLSDLDGVPMHAEANGFYFYEGGANKITVGRLFRMSPREIPDGLDKEAFAAFVAEQRPRWKKEAEEGDRLIEALSDKDE